MLARDARCVPARRAALPEGGARLAATPNRPLTLALTLIPTLTRCAPDYASASYYPWTLTLTRTLTLTLTPTRCAPGCASASYYPWTLTLALALALALTLARCAPGCASVR